MTKAINANARFDHPTAHRLSNSAVRDVLLNHGEPPSSTQRVRQVQRRRVRLDRQFADRP